MLPRSKNMLQKTVLIPQPFPKKQSLQIKEQCLKSISKVRGKQALFLQEQSRYTGNSAGHKSVGQLEKVYAKRHKHSPASSANIVLLFFVIRQHTPSNWYTTKPKQPVQGQFLVFALVRPEGSEPPTFWFVAKHSIQLSYGRLSQRQIL